MTDDEVVQLLREHWELHANAEDFETAHAIYHEDAVLEWPQSGERFVGKDKFRNMRENAPSLEFTTWRITGAGDHWVAENFMTVEGGEPHMTASILEFRGDKVAREIVYITQPFEASPERAALAEKFDPGTCESPST
ncbi:MAG: nuclear transport factor 2 family protein [Nocardioidaceae bacterium]